MARKVKRKLNIKALLVLLLVLYIIVLVFYTFLTRKVKNIYINETSLISDVEVIEAAGIKNYPAIFKLSKSSLEKKIKKIELVNDVQVSKNIFKGKIIIDIDEAVPLFYNRNTNKVMLSNGKEVENKYMGITTLINYTPTEILSNFTKSLAKVDKNVINMINEIEYNPDVNGDISIDENRFLLHMNDGNLVYVNIMYLSRMNNYQEIIVAVGDKKGTLLLDSYGSNTGVFTPFGSSDV